MLETQAVTMLCLRANWARGETAAAIGAYVFEQILDTVRTEGTFIGTDARLGGVGRQIPVTEFTIRTQF